MPLILFHPIHSSDTMDTNVGTNMVMEYDDDEEIGDVHTHGLQKKIVSKCNCFFLFFIFVEDVVMNSCDDFTFLNFLKCGSSIKFIV